LQLIAPQPVTPAVLAPEALDGQLKLHATAEPAVLQRVIDLASCWLWLLHTSGCCAARASASCMLLQPGALNVGASWVL
jgi:hypothetical protein